MNQETMKTHNCCPYCSYVYEGNPIQCPGCHRFFRGETDYLDKLVSKVNRSEVSNLYFSGKITKPEFLLLCSISSQVGGIYLIRFLTGTGEYSLCDYASGERYHSFTHQSHNILNAFYTVYQKFPDLEIDQYLAWGLTKLSTDQSGIYELLTLIENQLISENNGETPFYIDCITLLDNCKPLLKSNVIDYYSKIELRRKGKPSNLMDIIKEYNRTFNDLLNYDFLD